MFPDLMPGASDLHIKIENVMPQNLKSTLAVIDIHWQPDVATLPDGVQVPLVSHVQVCCLLCAIDTPGEAGLGAVRASVWIGDHEWLRPGSLEAICTEGDNVYNSQYFYCAVCIQVLLLGR